MNNKFLNVQTTYAGINLAEKRKKMEEKKYETGCCTDSKKRVKGVVCDVKSCAYHDGMSDCMAGKISVGPADAKSVSGTACVTFKPREY